MKAPRCAPGRTDYAIAHPLRALVAAALIGVGMVPPLKAQTLPLSALVMPGNQEHHVGKVVWVQLFTPDLSLAKSFYGSLFGWQFRDLKVGSEDYAEASLHGELVAGLMHKSVAGGERGQSRWLTFLAVRDADATRTLALANGARVLREPHTPLGRGREAVLQDPQGAVFAILDSSSGDPPDEMAGPGEWIWSSVSAFNPQASAGFYQSLFGYEVFDLPADAGEKHLMLATEDYARASATNLPENQPHAQPDWMNYIHVEDVAASIARVVSLGGRVLTEPKLDRHGGFVAIVADPLGAPFGLLEWPDLQGKGVMQ